MKHFLISAAVWLLAAHSALANDRIGNGGGVIVCPRADGSRSFEILDLYMARTQFGLHPDFANVPGPDYHDTARAILSRLAQKSPRRAALYLGWLNSFEEEADFKSGIKLVFIPDTGAQDIPSNCELRQLAVQRTDDERLPSERRFLIDKDLWDQLSNENKATLVTHELAYREALEGGMTLSSRFVRYFNANLISSEFLHIDQRQLTWDSRLGYYEEFGGIIQTSGKYLAYSNDGPIVRSDYLTLPSDISPPLCRVVSLTETFLSDVPDGPFSVIEGCGTFIYQTEIFAENKSLVAVFSTDNTPRKSTDWNFNSEGMAFVKGRLVQGRLNAPLNFGSKKICPSGGVLRITKTGKEGGWTCLIDSKEAFRVKEK